MSAELLVGILSLIAAVLALPKIGIKTFSEAREEIQRASAMTKNLREQELLANRLTQLEKATRSV